MTTITLSEIQKLSDKETLELLEKYPFPYQWLHKDALRNAQTTLSLMQGRNYIATGNRGELFKIVRGTILAKQPASGQDNAFRTKPISKF